jgi:pimeloyl-ACP methyl ester carboxylesterase
MFETSDQSIHVVSVGDDPSLLQLASLLQASHAPTVILQSEQGLHDLIDLLDASVPSGGFDAIHLYGHGTQGQQSLGGETISSDSLLAQRATWEQLKRFGHDETDLLLYGCKTGAGLDGDALVQSIAQLTGFDVAASDDITGIALTEYGSFPDWDLEVHVGAIQAVPEQSLRDWDGSLQLENWDDSGSYPFTAKPVRWRPDTTDSGVAIESAILRVPLDYSQPKQGTAKIALGRIPAQGQRPIGTLIFNPGGPGGSGIEALDFYPQTLSPRIQRRFHILSFDPRGIGKSTPTLQASPGLYPILPPNGSSDWTLSLNDSREAFRQANRKTQADNQDFINHLGTRNVARDLELIRQSIGDEKLNFIGVSYGTRIGYTYAEMFPDKIRTLVLDGNINPNGDFADLIVSAKGPDIAMRLVREKAPSIAAAFDEAYGILKEQPMDIGEGLEFTLGDYIQLVTFKFLLQGLITDVGQIAEYVIEAAANGDTQDEAMSWLRQLKSSMGSNDNAGGMFAVVNRLDYADSTSSQEQLSNVQDVVEFGPLGGPLAVSYAAGAEGFNLQPEPVPDMSQSRLRKKVKRLPVLITNATNDTVTPVFWGADRMTKAFKKHSLLQLVSTIHGITRAEDDWVNASVDKYLIHRKLPPSGTGPWQESFVNGV